MFGPQWLALHPGAGSGDLSAEGGCGAGGGEGAAGVWVCSGRRENGVWL